MSLHCLLCSCWCPGWAFYLPQPQGEVLVQYWEGTGAEEGSEPTGALL